ncbi:GntR family transcriptional regulator [Limosilactobacillus sp. STM2_1]|uniref:GntR family transcriptional regulator n=1 Tax=Limosilactobacillus rudii TaxID=2759755 RepID=A0A7W3UM28_9LACO|nr:GntR family transcriptional regulator [Limosilactobacillus rudii]MBB1079907.1 GntR family transcriptional regulator [Limosilactobacillus rudii]MBB1097986.1 GntR family transcriptional regulator [Limosilactobacillus rudii]MCD7135055.1 GntR family transcriptional regulator [Limosilactobacillus rudii]
MEVKYETVKQTLRNEIIDGKYQINEKLPTESALMKRFNVSRYTIRRAVGDLENEHYIYRIQGGGMFVQDWQRDWAKNEKNKIIGVISTHIADYIFPQIISGIDSVVTEQGYSMIVGNTLNKHDRERQTILNMLDLQIAGLIIEPTESAMPNPNLDLYRQIQKYKIPTILFHSAYPGFNFPTLLTKDREAEKNLIKYLFDLGHTNILGVFQVNDQQGVDRMGGMIQAYQEYGIPTTKSNVIMYQSGDAYDDIIKKIDVMLTSDKNITAIACYNDQLATRIISHLQGQGINVPQDISVVGFDNFEMAQIFPPSLTTANHPKRKLGEDAGKMILDMINGLTVESKTYLPAIIKGNSTAPLKAKEI